MWLRFVPHNLANVLLILARHEEDDDDEIKDSNAWTDRRFPTDNDDDNEVDN